MKLDVKIVKQKKNTKDCGLACLSMLLNFYNIDKSIQDLRKELVVHKNGTYIHQIGLKLIEYGFNIEIITMNPFLFTNYFKIIEQKKILYHLESLLNKNININFKKSLIFFINFMKSGGKINIKIPQKSDIINEITQGRPVMASLTSGFLLSKTPFFNHHFNIVTGIDDKYIYVNDPMRGKIGGKKKYIIDDFIYGIHANAYGDLDNASIMIIRK